MTSTPSLCSVLLLAALATGRAYAQFVPVSPNLSPELTANPDTEPITTLAIDLLAPQRPYIFDATGASLSANRLNPSIYSSSLSSSIVQTDTQLRDSSQTGHLSPYAAAAQRLGLSFSGSDDSSSEDNRGTSNGLFRGALPGQSGNYESGTDQASQSSWGTSSSFGGQSDQSSWGTGRLNVSRLGRTQPGSSDAGPGIKGELTTASNSNSYSAGNLSGNRSNRSNGFSSRYSIGGSSSDSTNSLASGSNSTNSLASRYGSSGVNSSGRGGMDLRTRSASSQDNSGELQPGGTAGASNGTSRDKPGVANSTLSFFPQASYSQSPLGESPFSSPSGADELHFLNPNIYAARSQGHVLSLSEKGSGAEESLRQAFVQRRHLATSVPHYGLNTHPGAEGMSNGIGDKSALQTHSHLSVLGSENQ